MSNRSALTRLLALLVVGGFVFVLSLHIEGCTAVGLVIGASADAQNGTGGVSRLREIKRGRPVTLTLWDGSSVQGRFDGWEGDSTRPVALADTASLHGKIVRLRTDRGERTFPAEEITRVTIVESSATLVCGLIGLGADVMIIHALSQPTVHTDNCGGQTNWGGIN